MSKYIDIAEADPHFEAWKQTIDFDTFPKEAAKRLRTSSDEERREWYAERFLCLRDPLVLGTHFTMEHPEEPDVPPTFVPVLGMDFQEEPHRVLFNQFLEMKPGQHCAYGDLDIAFKKRMILWPRGLFKTSSIIVTTVQTILNYPDIRICFLTGGNTLAKRQCARIKRVFERPTKRFLLLFPDFCLKSVPKKKKSKDPNEAVDYVDVPAKLGTAYEFTIPCRTKEIFAEPTFAISTAKSVKAGSHYDLIIIDDLVNETNYRSVALLEKVYQDYIDICPLLEPSGFMLLTGTRYSFGDTYERIQDKAKEEEKELGKTIWKFSIRDCWARHCQTCGHSEVWHNKDLNFMEPPCVHFDCTCQGFKSDDAKDVLFPQARTIDGRQIGHSITFLEGEKIRLGPEFFANQYENNPIATGSQTYTETLLGAHTLFHESQLPSYSQSFTFVVGDLAYVGQEGRDYSVLYVCRKFQGQIFVIDCEFGNWDSQAVGENTRAIILKHRPAALFYEKFNGWEAYNTIITAVCQQVGIQKVPIQWQKCRQTPKAKLARIGSIKGVFTSNRLWLYANIKGYALLVNQLVKWPKLGRHDDFADCLGQVVEAPTGYEAETPPPPPSATNWLRKLNEANGDGPGGDSYTDNGCGNGIVC